MFSKACEYAIKAMVFIQYKSQQNETTNLSEIAEAIDSPAAFTAKILQQLRKSDLLESIMGVKGGFRILENKQISLKEIIVAIDGNGIFSNCVLGLKACSSTNPCPVHNKYAKIRGEMERIMQKTFLADLANQLNLKKISLK